MVSEDVRERVTSYIKHQATKSNDAVLELVATSQQQFLDVVDGVDDDLARRPEAPGEWCLRELLRHVIDAENLVAALVENLSRGMRPAIRGSVGSMIEDDTRPQAELIAQLRQANARLLDNVRALDERADLQTTAPHPFFGPLNCREWAAFQRIHDADHVQHANKILAVARA